MGAFSGDTNCSLTTGLMAYWKLDDYTVPTNQLSAYWKLDEASGSRADSHGSNTLTDNNTVTQSAGKVGNSAQFTAANTEFLSIADNAAISTGDIDYTWALWVYFDTVPTTTDMVLIDKDGGVAGAREYTLVILRNFPTSGNTRIRFRVFDGTNQVGVVYADTLGNVATGTWYFVVAWHDSVANTVNIQVNNGTVDSAATTGGTADGTNGLRFGRGDAGSGDLFDGRLDEIGFWKRTLSTAERTVLYNSGNGTTYGSRSFFDSITPGTGPAAQFTSANSEYLSIADNAFLSTGNIDFSFVGWVYLDSKTTSRGIASKGTLTGSTDEWNLYYDNVADKFTFDISANGTTIAVSVTASSLGSPSTGTWYFIVCWHDATADTINIQVNDGTVDSSATSGSAPADRAGAFEIGRTNAATYMDGRITLTGFWKKVLSSTERTHLYNSGVGLHSTQIDTTLPTSLISYWNLNEWAGIRYDSLGLSGNDLTDNNTVTQTTGLNGGSTFGDYNTVTGATGKVSGSAQFVSANSEFLSTPDSTTLSTGDIDFTWAGWVYLDSKTTDQGLVNKGDNTSVYEYLIYYDTTLDRFRIQINNGASEASVNANNFGAVSTGTWYFVVCWHDSVNNVLGIQINNGTANTTSTSIGVQDTTGALHLGALAVTGGLAALNGRLDEVGFWKKVLTSDEKTILYNSGDGNTYDPAATCSNFSRNTTFMALFD